MQVITREIYDSWLPEELLVTMAFDDAAILEFILGSRSLSQIQQYRLEAIVHFVDKNPISELVKTQIFLRGHPYWITIWLLEYYPEYP